MNCADFTRWLDDGRPDGGAAAMEAHAASCARCAAARRAALELDEAFAAAAAAPEPAPERFTDVVMRRVRAAGLARAGVLTLGLPPALAWWVRAAADPLVALSILLASLLVWRHAALWTFVAGLSTRLTAFGEVTLRLPGEAALSFALPPSLHAFASPTVLLGLGLALTPAVLWVSWQLYRWSEQAFATVPLHRAR